MVQITGWGWACGGRWHICGDAAAVVGDEWLVGAGGEPPKEGSGVGCVVGKRVVMGHGEQYGCEAARGMVGLWEVVY